MKDGEIENVIKKEFRVNIIVSSMLSEGEEGSYLDATVYFYEAKCIDEVSNRTEILERVKELLAVAYSCDANNLEIYDDEDEDTTFYIVEAH